jgi:hypothetical protein
MSLLCNAFPNNDNSICVNTGEVKSNKNTLVTSFVNTCSVLGFSHNRINFLAHIDAINPNMLRIIKKELQKFDIKNIKEIHIWKGKGCYDNCPSYEIVKNLIKLFNKNIKINYNKSNYDIIKIKT